MAERSVAITFVSGCISAKSIAHYIDIRQGISLEDAVVQRNVEMIATYYASSTANIKDIFDLVGNRSEGEFAFEYHQIDMVLHIHTVLFAFIVGQRV